MGSMQHFFQQTQIAPNVLFMPSVFNETMDLLTDAHEYFHLFGSEDQENAAADIKALYAQEMSRITLRLSSIMAWLMMQRAVASGKIPAEEAVHYALGFSESCMVDSSVLHGILPEYVCHLLDRTHELYARVMRLDNQMRMH